MEPEPTWAAPAGTPFISRATGQGTSRGWKEGDPQISHKCTRLPVALGSRAGYLIDGIADSGFSYKNAQSSVLYSVRCK